MKKSSITLTSTTKMLNNEALSKLLGAIMPYIASIIIAVTGVLTFFLTRKTTQKQAELDAGKFIVEAAKALIEPYVNQVKNLEQTVKENRDEIARLNKMISDKNRTIANMGEQIFQRDNTIRLLQDHVSELSEKVIALEAVNSNRTQESKPITRTRKPGKEIK